MLLTLAGLTLGQPWTGPSTSCAEGTCGPVPVQVAGRSAYVSADLCAGKVHKILVTVTYATTARDGITQAADPRVSANEAALVFVSHLRSLGWTLEGATPRWTSGKQAAHEAAVSVLSVAAPPIIPEGAWLASMMLDPNLPCSGD